VFMWAATLAMLAVYEYLCKKLIRSTVMVKQNLFHDSDVVSSPIWNSILWHFEKTVSFNHSA